jgi:ERCC4-type nuclease
MPDVHPHALDGALVSLAAMWRLPVLQSRDPDHSLLILRFLADQASERRDQVLRRFDRKPKRLASRRLFVLQALPGVGPAIARRLLGRFGSVERAMAADEAALTSVRGLGPRKAAQIRDVACGPAPPAIHGAAREWGHPARLRESDPDYRVASRPPTIYIDRR